MTHNLPAGVRIRPLTMHRDFRGAFTEVFRDEWDAGMRPVQWNAVRSDPRVLRGVHVHLRHWDYLSLASGKASIGLRDLRSGSPTEGQALCIELSGDEMAALTIPPGVAHGFLFHTAALHFYAVSEYFDPTDELGCHWADPELGIPWPVTDVILSPRDADAPPLRVLLDRLAPSQPIGAASPPPGS